MNITIISIGVVFRSIVFLHINRTTVMDFLASCIIYKTSCCTSNIKREGTPDVIMRLKGGADRFHNLLNKRVHETESIGKVNSYK